MLVTGSIIKSTDLNFEFHDGLRLSDELLKHLLARQCCLVRRA